MYDRNNLYFKEDIENTIEGLDVTKLFGKTILITGISGLIGSFLVEVLMYLNLKQDAGIEIFGIGRDRQKVISIFGEYYTHPLFHFIEQDVRNPLVVGCTKIDYVIHGASNAHPRAYAEDPVGTITTNVIGTNNLLRLALTNHAEFLYMSTNNVYGDSLAGAFKEDYDGIVSINTSRSCYPESKRLCETLCRSYIEQYGLIVKIVRLSRVFGPTMSDNDSKVSAQFIRYAKAKSDIILRSKGTQCYSYTYTPDVVSAILFVILKGLNNEAYNVSNENCNVTLRDFASIVATIVHTKIIFDTPDDIDSKGYMNNQYSILINDKLKKLGWQPKYGMKDAIQRTLSIYEEKI